MANTNDLQTIIILRSFMEIAKGTKPQEGAMAALGLIIILAHEAGHDQESLIDWFTKRVMESDTWHCFNRKFVENAFNDPRMPKPQ